MEPEVGLPTDGSGCAFSADLDSPACGESETIHLAVQSTTWGLVALSSCDRHVPIARTTGQVLAEHAYQASCATIDCWAGVA